MPPGFSGSGGAGATGTGGAGSRGGVSTLVRPGQPAPSTAAVVVSTSSSAAPARTGRGVLSESCPNQTNLGRNGGSGCEMPVFDASGAGDAACGGGIGGGRSGVTEAPVQPYHSSPGFDYAAAAPMVVGGSDTSTACAVAPDQTVCAAPRLEARASPPMAAAIGAGAIGACGGTDGAAAAAAAAMGGGGGGDEFDMSQVGDVRVLWLYFFPHSLQYSPSEVERCCIVQYVSKCAFF